MPPASRPPVAFVIGAGPHIGNTVAHMLYEEGYQVALGSRHPAKEIEHMDKFTSVVVDAANPASIRNAFKNVVKEFGPPTVVIYNAASFVTPPEATDPLSLEAEYFHDAACTGAGVFTAAQEAVDSFRHESRMTHPKVFIVTGNMIAFERNPNPEFLCLSIQKSIEAQLIEALAESYEKENFRFYFASLVSKSGGLDSAEFLNSAPVHAKIYWDLIAHTQEQGSWDFRFTPNGERYEPKET